MLTKICLLFAYMVGSQVHASPSFTIAPYLILDDQSQRTLSFHSTDDVQFKINGSRLETTNNTFNKIALGPLLCGEALEYSVLKSGQEILKKSLKALPCDPEESYYFGFLSDTQIKNKWAQNKADQLAQAVENLKKKFPINLIVNAGDIVQHGGFEAEWINFFKTTERFTKDSYLIAAVGNHEYYESPSLDKAPENFLKYLRNGSNEDLGYMQVSLGKINLLVINSNFESMTEGKIREQWLWLEAKLIEAEKQNIPSFVTLHHSPYSSNLEHLRETPRRLREELVPLLEKFSSVKMVLSGHLHMYERSQKNGITYLTAGPSGGIFNVFSYYNPYSLVTKQLTTTFTIFKVKGNQIQVTTYNDTEVAIDSFSIDIN